MTKEWYIPHYTSLWGSSDKVCLTGKKPDFFRKVEFFLFPDSGFLLSIRISGKLNIRMLLQIEF